QYNALADAFLLGFGGVAAGEKASAAGADRRSGELGVFGERVRVGNRKIGRNPISLGHHCLPNCLAIRAHSDANMRDYQARLTESEGVARSQLTLRPEYELRKLADASLTTPRMRGRHRK